MTIRELKNFIDKLSEEDLDRDIAFYYESYDAEGEEIEASEDVTDIKWVSNYFGKPYLELSGSKKYSIKI